MHQNYYHLLFGLLERNIDEGLRDILMVIVVPSPEPIRDI